MPGLFENIGNVVKAPFAMAGNLLTEVTDPGGKVRSMRQQQHDFQQAMTEAQAMGGIETKPGRQRMIQYLRKTNGSPAVIKLLEDYKPATEPMSTVGFIDALGKAEKLSPSAVGPAKQALMSRHGGEALPAEGLDVFGFIDQYGPLMGKPTPTIEQQRATAAAAEEPWTSRWERLVPAREQSVNVTVGGKPASPTERTAIAETNASLDALDNLKALFDSHRTRSGPVVGRADPYLGLINMTTQEQEDFMAATSAFKNFMIKEITGAQMSEVEAERIMKQIPLETDPPKRWMAKWRQSKKNLIFLQKRRAQTLRQSGLIAPGGTAVTKSEKIRVRSPGGQTGLMDSAELAEAEKHGWKRVD